jgi:hypothetical protein
MIKDNIITLRYRPDARRKYCFKYEYWRNGKVSKSMCRSQIDCPSDSIFGSWGDKFSGKNRYYNLSAYVAYVFFTCCHHAWYLDICKDNKDFDEDQDIKYHKQKLAIYSVIYDMFLDFFDSRSAQLFGGEDDLYMIFKIHHEVFKIHDVSMSKISKDPDNVDLDEFSKKEILFKVMCDITKIRFNDYKIVKDFKRVKIEEWKDGTYPKSPVNHQTPKNLVL